MSPPLRVLIVEDSEDDVLSLLRELRRGDYSPVYQRVDTPQEMAAALAGEPWDIVVSDYNMPQFSGPAALRLLQQSQQDLPSPLTVSYSVSHDLRSPLRSIDGFSQALLEDYEDKLDDDGKDYLRRVRAASQRMAQLIDDLLQLSRLTRKEMSLEEVDMSGMARVIAADLRSADPQREAEFVIGEELTVKGDGKLLEVMLENLLGNAWKFTGKQPRARIEFNRTERDGQEAYYVRDNGAGFDMDYAGAGLLAGKLPGVAQQILQHHL